MSQFTRQTAGGLWRRGGKRAFDVGVAGAALATTWPVLVGGALLVKATSPGPVLYRQQRTGLNGRRFDALKLRTMSATRRHDPHEVVSLSHSEVTPVGRWLRRFKIDELPQILNVLRGDMSIVGPRPTIPEQTDRYDAFERQRLLVRPGLTGLAQVNGNAAISWAERIRYDVHYVKHCSALLDAEILLRTPAVVLLGEERFARAFASSKFAEAS